MDGAWLWGPHSANSRFGDDPGQRRRMARALVPPGRVGTSGFRHELRPIDRLTLMLLMADVLASGLGPSLGGGGRTRSLGPIVRLVRKSARADDTTPSSSDGYDPSPNRGERGADRLAIG
jgi:hypothetical protein